MWKCKNKRLRRQRSLGESLEGWEDEVEAPGDRTWVILRVHSHNFVPTFWNNEQIHANFTISGIYYFNFKKILQSKTVCFQSWQKTKTTKQNVKKSALYFESGCCVVTAREVTWFCDARFCQLTPIFAWNRYSASALKLVATAARVSRGSVGVGGRGLADFEKTLETALT